MAKGCIDNFLDGAFDVMINSATHITVCKAAPASFAEAVSTHRIAQSVTSGGNFAKANGDTNGRKVTLKQIAGISVSSTGNANHIAVVNSAGGQLIYWTTCTSQQLTQGNTVTVNAWDIEIADPT